MEPPSREKVNPQSSAHETSANFALRLLQIYSCARQKTALQISLVDLPSGSAFELPDSGRQYNAAAPIVVMTIRATKLRIASFDFHFYIAAVHLNSVPMDGGVDLNQYSSIGRQIYTLMGSILALQKQSRVVVWPLMGTSRA